MHISRSYPETNASINRFANDVGMDEKIKKIDISIISFSYKPVIEKSWRTLSDMRFVIMEERWRDKSVKSS